MSSTRLIQSTLALVTLGLLSACGGTGAPVCAKYAECANDPPGADYQQICQTRYQAELDALRANEEEECSDIAAKKEAYDACRSGLECRDFVEGDNNGECEDEREDFIDAFNDADNSIGGRALGSNGAGPYLPDLLPERCSSWD